MAHSSSRSNSFSRLLKDQNIKNFTVLTPRNKILVDRLNTWGNDLTNFKKEYNAKIAENQNVLKKKEAKKAKIKPKGIFYSGNISSSRKGNRIHKQIKTVSSLNNNENISDAHNSVSSDCNYLLEGMQSKSLYTQCLSILQLASKSMDKKFHMYLQANEVIVDIFKILKDISSNPSCMLSSSVLLFALSQNKLPSILDFSTLSWMISIIQNKSGITSSCDVPESSVIFEKIKRNAVNTLRSILGEGHDSSYNLTSLNVSDLMLLALLNEVDKRAYCINDASLKSLTVLECITQKVSHIVKKIYRSCNGHLNYLELPSSRLDMLLKCLKALEKMVENNSENLSALLNHNNFAFLMCFLLYLKLFTGSGKQLCEKTKYFACFMQFLKVMTVIVYNKDLSCREIVEYILKDLLICIIQKSDFVPKEQQFEYTLMIYGLIINIIHQNDVYQKAISDMCTTESYIIGKSKIKMRAIEYFIKIFHERLNTAKSIDCKTSDLLNSSSEEMKEAFLNQKDFSFPARNLEDIYNAALQNADVHMEHILICAYIVIILGFVIKDNQKNALSIKRLIPKRSFNEMINVLEKLSSFIDMLEPSCEKEIKLIKDTIIVLKHA